MVVCKTVVNNQELRMYISINASLIHIFRNGVVNLFIFDKNKFIISKQSLK